MSSSLQNGMEPFEFRAGIYLDFTVSLTAISCLNPFEFRAGIYLHSVGSGGNKPRVLIPLNSGLVFTWHGNPWHRLEPGLNPFEFRAGIYFQLGLNNGGPG